MKNHHISLPEAKAPKAVAKPVARKVAISKPAHRRPIQLHRILVPVDFTEHSRRALEYAVALAGMHQARITVLFVAEPLHCLSDYGYGPVERCQPNQTLVRRALKNLERFVWHAVPAALRNSCLVRSGIAFEEILRCAHESPADLIVLATRGSGLPGSTTERVVRHADCPVLVVRERERDFVR